MAVESTFNLTFAAKAFFLDSPRIEALLDAATRKNLMHAGGKVRTIARRSMRYVTAAKEQERLIRLGLRKRLNDPQASRPGEPPRAIRPHPWIREHLLFAYDPASQVVVVGPVGFAAGSGAPAILEHGGRTRIRNKRRILRKVGHGGEIAVGAQAAKYCSAKTNADGAPVVYIRLCTQAQADRANRLNEQLYGPLYRIAYIEPRPFMGPALSQVQPSLPGLWANSISA